VSNQPQPRRIARRTAKRVARRGLRPRDAAYVIVVLWVFFVVVFGVVEHLVDPDTFGSVWLGMWWGAQTVTTVGYGDIVPQDTVGQVIAVFLMLGGLSLLAVATGAITSAFVTQAQAERRDAGDDPVMRRLQDVSAQLDQIKAELSSMRRGDPG
jgi:voltage-gated potassium channel Kch